MNAPDRTPKPADLPPEVKAEFLKRLESFELDAKAARPVEEVLAELRQRFAPKP
jgi:hypothetical protein